MEHTQGLSGGVSIEERSRSEFRYTLKECVGTADQGSVFPNTAVLLAKGYIRAIN